MTDTPWGGIWAAVETRVADGSFGFRYPSQCPDEQGTYGCNEASFWAALRANVPDLGQRIGPGESPPTLAVLDAIEFCYDAVAKPDHRDFHGYFRHWHLIFDPKAGRRGFREEINRIFARNGLVYELQPNGQVVRLAPEPLRQALVSAVFETGDDVLDGLLEAARRKYLDPDPAVRVEALEKLWDAWERIKTIEPGGNKAESAKRLLDSAARGPEFRSLLEDEAKELTRIGNTFQIRHSEIGKIPISREEDMDYLFHRAFALIRLLLKTTGRGG